MNTFPTPASLTARLQEKLDAAVQSPQAFVKSADKSNIPSIIPDCEDEEGSVPTSSNLLQSKADDLANAVADSSKGSTNGSGAPSDTFNSSYRDWSTVLPEKTSGDIAVSLGPRGAASAKEPTFPVKLHMILSNPEFQDIISWLPHGRSWRILQQNAFEERVIPLYFRHGRYSSFARQVNGWGFRRVTHGSDYNSYYHEMFLRGMPHLCQKMRRLTKTDNNRKKNDDEPAPDFYAMSRSHPLPETTPTTATKTPTAHRPYSALLGAGAGAPTNTNSGLSALTGGTAAATGLLGGAGLGNSLASLAGTSAGAMSAGLGSLSAGLDGLSGPFDRRRSADLLFNSLTASPSLGPLSVPGLASLGGGFALGGNGLSAAALGGTAGFMGGLAGNMGMSTAAEQSGLFKQSAMNMAGLGGMGDVLAGAGGGATANTASLQQLLGMAGNPSFNQQLNQLLALNGGGLTGAANAAAGGWDLSGNIAGGYGI